MDAALTAPAVSVPRYNLRPSHMRMRAMRLVAAAAVVSGLAAFAYFRIAPQQQSSLPSSPSSSVLDLKSKSKSSKKSSSSQPNFVFVLADDMGYGSLSEGVTPFTYKLQKKSVVLENYYSQETCTPARAALLTGRYPLTIGVQFYEQEINHTGGLPEDETTFAEVLQDKGYTTYILGKWNLGNEEAAQLPTARGFDYYLGFLDAYNHYWSKRNPDFPDYKDFLYSDSECYYAYDGDDYTTYSTTIFTNAAASAINSHDFDDTPMFMFVSLQAARAPFDDYTSSNGLEDSYLESVDASDANSYVNKNVDGTVQQQYFKSIAVMDKTIEGVYNALDSRGVIDNSYIIFASDNGGCPTAGGRNYPLRGTKGSLFEGGVKVEAFIYSPMFASKLQGSTYSNVFHVSDWFPTILDMAGASYSPSSKYKLDGVSHLDAITDGKDAPREYMLYNYYYDASDSKTDLWSGKAMAIRNERYKLMHTYDSPIAGVWYDASETMREDDDLASYDNCAQFNAISSGTFTYFLFDLKEDPTEKVNLYGQDDYADVQKELYAALDDLQDNAADYCVSKEASGAAKVWASNDDYVVPWGDSRRRLQGSRRRAGRRLSSKYPSNCGLWSESYAAVVGDDADEAEEKSSSKTAKNVMKSSGKAASNSAARVFGKFRSNRAVSEQIMQAKAKKAAKKAAKKEEEAESSSSSRSDKSGKSSKKTADKKKHSKA